jgi:uncharacterized protein
VSSSEAIEQFLAIGSFAVVGASSNRDKYGNKVLRCYGQHELSVVAVNPRAQEIEGFRCYATLRDVPGEPRAVSVVAPPGLAQSIVDDAIESGVRHLWFQPGAEDQAAVDAGRQRGLEIIAGGACLLVALGFRDQ